MDKQDEVPVPSDKQDEVPVPSDIREVGTLVWDPTVETTLRAVSDYLRSFGLSIVEFNGDGGQLRGVVSTDNEAYLLCPGDIITVYASPFKAHVRVKNYDGKYRTPLK